VTQVSKYVVVTEVLCFHQTTVSVSELSTR